MELVHLLFLRGCLRQFYQRRLFGRYGGFYFFGFNFGNDGSLP